MQIRCGVCGAALRAEDVRMDLALAKCGTCSAVIDLSDRKRAVPDTSERAIRSVRPKPALPSKFQVEDRGSSLSVKWRWFSPTYLFLAFFCLFWDGILVSWYGAALSGKGPPLVFLLFPLIHVAVGVGLTYTTLAGFVNHTRIEVSRDRLSIRHGPLPWLGTKELPGRSLKQLYGMEVISRGRNGTSVSYQLLALDRDDVRVTLLTGLTEKEQVLWLEQALEKRLGIEDFAVDGEVATRTITAA